MERTFIMVKPDGVRRKLIGEVIKRIETRDFCITAMKILTAPKSLAERHYIVHSDKEFYGELVDFISSGPVVAMVVEGDNSVGLLRKMMGATKPEDAAPGTIRGDFSLSTRENIVHGSDSVESAEYEIGLWFPELVKN